MKISLFLGFQGADWIDHDGQNVSIRDGQIYEENLRIADLVEPLGFDALFNVEHHSTPHHMTSNPLALLYYMAGRTERIGFGTSVIVLPWSNPLRAAEELCVLDNLSGGRDVYVGVGRGSSPSEYKALNVDQNEASDRFREGAEILKLALRGEPFSYSGQFHSYDEVLVRPRPINPSFGREIFGAIATRPSLELIAELGLHLMSTGGASVEKTAENVNVFNALRAEHGLPPGKSIIGVPMYCSSDADDAHEVAHRCFGGYYQAAINHYKYNDRSQFAKIKGYEHYASSSGDGTSSATFQGLQPEKLYIESGIYGTPDRCIERIRAIREATDTDHIIMLTMTGGVSSDATAASLELFSKEVLPVVTTEMAGVGTEG